jgi:hypothetical protein
VQQLSLNPQKLAGQCGKLKCCLNYEYEMYQEAAKDFPDPEIPLFFRKGKAIWQKTDVFARTMYYAYANEQNESIGLPVEAVHEIIKLNQHKDFPEGLEQFSAKGRMKVVPNDEVVEMFDNVVGQDELTRFDKKKSHKQQMHHHQHQHQRPPHQQREDKPHKHVEHPHSKPPHSEHSQSKHSHVEHSQSNNNPRPNNQPQQPQQPQQRSEQPVKRHVREIQKPILKPKTNPDA